MTHDRNSLLIRRGLIVMALACLLLPGCSRSKWREQADDKTYDILYSKQFEPLWTVPRVELQADPRSRFFDPYDPDCAPLPPDDPAAHQYMHCVYGMKGYKHWHQFGDLTTVENPYWLDPFGMSQEVVEANYGKPGLLPEIKEMRLEEAVALAYIHSRDFQLQLENLYLSALTLTFERFRFDVQFLGIGNRRPSSDFLFESNPGVEDSINEFNRVGVSKLLPTGGQWAAELANNTLWLFAGGDRTTTTSSIISMSLVQPLLAGGGRRFALESLTQSERDVLYQLRNFARFRMSFFTGLISSGQGANGYLSLLTQQQTIYNTRYNIRQQVEQLERLRADATQRPEEMTTQLETLPAGLVFPPLLAQKMRYDADKKLLYLRSTLSDVEVKELLALNEDPNYQTAVRELAQRASLVTVTLQIAQQQGTLANTYIQLLNNERQLQDQLDQYKILLGLPTDMPVSVDESLLKPFQLIDPRVTQLQDDLKLFVNEWADVIQDDPAYDKLQRILPKLVVMGNRVRDEGLIVLEDDIARVLKVMPQRLAALDTDEEKQRVTYNVERDQRLFGDLRDGFRVFSDRLQKLEAALAEGEPPLDQRVRIFNTLVELREDLLTISQGFSAVQTGLRTELITLNTFDMTLEQAVGIGLENRMDLMNSRGAVMDARRKMEVAANQLQAVMNVVAQGDIRTQGVGAGNNNPVDFRGDQSSFRFGVQFTAPIQLVQQRNIYRASLITYQQARRAYMLTEDQVKQQIRVDWRQLNVLRRNFETARQAVRINAVQLDSAIEQGLAPGGGTGGGGQPAGGGQGGGGNNGLNLTQAFQGLLGALNTLVQTWANYESFRLNIYRDMGIMEIDPQGFWTDEFYQDLERKLDGSRLMFGADLPQELAPPAALPEQPSVIVPPPAGAQLQEPDHARRLKPAVSRRLSPPSLPSRLLADAKPRQPSSPPLAAPRVRRQESADRVVPAGVRGDDRRLADPRILPAAGQVVSDHGSGQKGTAGY